MAIYIIHGERVTACDAVPAKLSKGSLIVRSADEIASSNLPSPRLVSLWNALPGVAPLKKFKTRKVAAQRLWGAFQRLSPPPEQKPAHPKKEKSASKQARVISMLQNLKGATVAEIADATNWQPHTVRGAISGVLKKKLGLSVISEKTERGRVYRIVEGKAKRAA